MTRRLADSTPSMGHRWVKPRYHCRQDFTTSLRGRTVSGTHASDINTCEMAGPRPVCYADNSDRTHHAHQDLPHTSAGSTTLKATLEARDSLSHDHYNFQSMYGRREFIMPVSFTDISVVTLVAKFVPPHYRGTLPAYAPPWMEKMNG